MKKVSTVTGRQLRKAGRAWREKRQEAGHRGHGKKAGGAAASLVGERRGIRAVAQLQPNDRGRSRVKQTAKPESKSFQEEKRKKPKPSSGDCVSRLAHVSSLKKREVVNQMAAPAEPRTPNMHQAKRIAL